jgi:RNA polymerase sigma factor (sigma-70 family)
MTASHGPDDAALVQRCRAGDATAWPLLVARYQRLVHTIVRRAGLDEQVAADVFQTVFLRLLQHLPRIADAARLQAWIVTTAKREALLQRRRGRREVVVEPADARAAAGPNEAADGAHAPGPEEAVERWQQVVRVREALERLDERCRSLLLALFADPPPGYDALARQLGMPPGSVGPTRGRCLEKLRRSLS